MTGIFLPALVAQLPDTPPSQAQTAPGGASSAQPGQEFAALMSLLFSVPAKTAPQAALPQDGTPAQKAGSASTAAPKADTSENTLKPPEEGKQNFTQVFSAFPVPSYTPPVAPQQAATVTAGAGNAEPSGPETAGAPAPASPTDCGGAAVPAPAALGPALPSLSVVTQFAAPAAPGQTVAPPAISAPAIPDGADRALAPVAAPVSAAPEKAPASPAAAPSPAMPAQTATGPVGWRATAGQARSLGAAAAPAGLPAQTADKHPAEAAAARAPAAGGNKGITEEPGKKKDEQSAPVSRLASPLPESATPAAAAVPGAPQQAPAPAAIAFAIPATRPAQTGTAAPAKALPRLAGRSAPAVTRAPADAQTKTVEPELNTTPPEAAASPAQEQPISAQDRAVAPGPAPAARQAAAGNELAFAARLTQQETNEHPAGVDGPAPPTAAANASSATAAPESVQQIQDARDARAAAARTSGKEPPEAGRAVPDAKSTAGASGQPVIHSTEPQQRPAVAAAPPPAKVQAPMQAALEKPAPAEAAAKPQPVRELSVQVPQTASEGSKQDAIEVRVIERAGQVHVAVRSGDNQLNESLRGDLGDLVTQLENKGYRAETWRPTDLPTVHGVAATSQSSAQQFEGGANHHGSSGSGQERQDTGGGDSSQQQRRDQEQERPQWLDMLEGSFGQNNNPIRSEQS